LPPLPLSHSPVFFPLQKTPPLPPTKSHATRDMHKCEVRCERNGEEKEEREGAREKRDMEERRKSPSAFCVSWVCPALPTWPIKTH
jgi:hypothetical protein